MAYSDLKTFHKRSTAYPWLPVEIPAHKVTIEITPQYGLSGNKHTGVCVYRRNDYGLGRPIVLFRCEEYTMLDALTKCQDFLADTYEEKPYDWEALKIEENKESE